MNRICIIIPTCDRPECINYYLKKKASVYFENRIDMIVYDSSGNNLTKAVALRFTAQGFSNVKYTRYEETTKTECIDNKVFSAAKSYCRKYDYICFSGDGTIVNLELIFAELHRYKAHCWDLIVYDNAAHMQISRKEYPELTALFQECCWRMTLLASVILSGELLELCTNSLSADHELWLPMSLFYTPPGSAKRAVYLADKRFWETSPKIHESSWKASGGALRQWGKLWCDAIDALPHGFDKYKSEVLRSHDRYTRLFSIKSLMNLKASGNITWRTVREFRPYLSRVTETHPFWFYAIALGVNRRLAVVFIRFYHLCRRRKV